jgi:DnaJ homolog subfamily C member 28
MTKQDSSQDRDDHPLKRVSLRTFESVIDQQIRAAEAEGQFQNLAGAGEPLTLNDDAHIPEELRAGFRMLKNAGAAPPWIELQQTIRVDQEGLVRWLKQANARWERLTPQQRATLREEYSGKLRDLNKLISTYNLTAPPAVGQFPLLIMEQELKKLGN